MPALSTDKFKKVGNPGTATSLSAPGYTAGATSINVASTTNWPADTGMTFCMYEVTTVGTETVMTAGTYNEYDGVVTGATSIGSLSHVAGSGTDRNYAAGTGTVVTIMVTAGRENTLVDGLLVSHNQDGTLKAGAVDAAAVLADNVVETAKIKDANVTLPKINGGSTAGVLVNDGSGGVQALAPTLGYAQITTTFNTTSATPVAVSGLDITITVPAGGRRVKITAWSSESLNLNANCYAVTSIWDGAVGSGTKIAESVIQSAIAGMATPMIALAVVIPSAGTKTYRVGLNQSAGGTARLAAVATRPAFILAELI